LWKEPLLLVDQVYYQTISTLVEQQRSFAMAFCPEMTKSTAKSLAEKKTARYSATIHADLSFSTRLPLEERSAKQAKTESGKETTRCKLQETSWAVVIWQSLLGRGWKDVLLRMWWLEGRMRAVRALLTHSPSTPPILTSEFVMADLLAFS
jgi:hypothetical protein